MTDFVAPTVDWAALSPVVIVLLAAVVGVLVEAFVPARVRRPVQLALAVAALAGAVVAVAALWSGVEETGGTVVLGGSLLVDGPTLVLQATIALLALVALLIIADRTETGEDAFAPNAAAVPGSDYEELARRKGVQQTEIYPLVLFATGGMLIFPATGDLLTLFVALEVLSLPLYLLTGMARRRRLLSQEASMKYFLLGAFSSALLLFGIALVYGYSGSLRYSEIAEATQVPGGLDSLLLVGSVLLLSGLLFKVGAVPFHTWTPDVYQGAPTPITGLHGGVHQGRGVRRAPADRLHDAAGPGVGPRRRALDGGHPHDGRRHGRGPGPDGHEARPRLLLDRPRRVHPHRHHRAEPGRHRRGAVLPAGLRGGDGRRVRHRLAGQGACRRARRRATAAVRSSARPPTCRSGPGSAGRTRCSPSPSASSCSRSRASR